MNIFIISKERERKESQQSTSKIEYNSCTSLTDFNSRSTTVPTPMQSVPDPTTKQINPSDESIRAPCLSLTDSIVDLARY